MARQSVLGPRLPVKRRQQEILSRNKHLYLIPEVLLEGSTTPRKGGTERASCNLSRPAKVPGPALPVVDRHPEVMPSTQAYGPLMLLLLGDATAAIGDVLDRRRPIGNAGEQARQAAAVAAYGFHPFRIVRPDRRGFTDHEAARMPG
jgi:hypothetical protein